MINMKKTLMIYNELGLQLRNKHPKRRVKAKLREDHQEAVRKPSGRTMSGRCLARKAIAQAQSAGRDFVHDQLALGRRLRILTVADTHFWLSPAADPRFTYRGEDVVQTLERLCGQIGCPKTIRDDSGSGFISRVRSMPAKR